MGRSIKCYAKEMSRSYAAINDRLHREVYTTDPNRFLVNRHILETTADRLSRKNAATIRYTRSHTRRLQKARDLLTAFAAPNVIGYPPAAEVWINRTLEQGDCFYSSIYRAAGERGFLPLLRDRLRLNIRTEYAFIGSFRNRIAKEVRADHLPTDVDQYGRPENTYDILHRMGDSLGAAMRYDEVFPEWFKQAFEKGTGTRKSFLRTFAKGIRVRQNFISEIELAIATRLLDRECGILLEIDGMVQSVLPKYKMGKPLITLYNKYGGHYEYYSFLDVCPAGKERNRATRMCEAKCKADEERRPPKFRCTKKKTKAKK